MLDTTSCSTVFMLDSLSSMGIDCNDGFELETMSCELLSHIRILRLQLELFYDSMYSARLRVEDDTARVGLRYSVSYPCANRYPDKPPY